MTDFYQWGNEYLQESLAIKAKIELLKQENKTAAPSASKELNYRIGLLYSMYLDCKHTGLLLQSYQKGGE